MKNTVLFFLPVFLFLSACGQASFLNIIPVEGASLEGMDIIPASDDGYIICGKGAPRRLRELKDDMGIKRGECFVLKVDTKGDTVWIQSIPGLEAQHLLQADDGGYFVSGFSRGHREDIYSGDRGQGVFLIKINPEGHVEWGKMLEHPENCTTEGMTRLTDGRIAILGILERQYVIFLLDQEGNEAGKITAYGYLPPAQEEDPGLLNYSLSRDYVIHSSGGWGYDICGTQEGGIALIGTKGHGLLENAFFLQLFDSNGKPILFKEFRWKREPDEDFDWSRDSDDDNWGMSITELKNGDLLLGGCNHYHPDELRMARVSKKGREVWTESFNGWTLDETVQVLEMKNGTCVIGGNAEDMNKLTIAAVDEKGNKLWQKEYPMQSEGGQELEFGAFCETPDGGLIITGKGDSFRPGLKDKSDEELMEILSRTYYSDALFVLKTNSDGEFEE